MSYIINGNKISFSNNDFLAKGGQGSVYIKGSTVYKIYTDISEMISTNKIKELQEIKNNKVLVPDKIIYDANNHPVGFTMPYINNTIPLIKLFNTGYRDNIGFNEHDTLSLIEQMQRTIQHIHDKKILQIDGNELNYIVGDNNKTSYFIDVDSYQTENYKASVIMPSIRDWHNKQFSTLTDWYSFGIIACQLFIGLHPYKGRHPSYKRDLKQRALDNISIFNKDVTVPKAVRDFGNIPSEYMNWFTKMFEKGERLPPPLVSGTLSIKPKVTVCVGSNLVKIKEIPRTHKYFNSINLPWNNKELKVSIENKRLFITDEKDIRIHSILCSEFMIYNSVIYAKYNNKLNEIRFIGFNDTVTAKINSFSVATNSTKVMDGFVSQNLLGKTFLSIPYEIGKISDIAIPELDNYKIIDGKYENKVSMIIGLNIKTNKYDKIILIYNKIHKNYSIDIIEDVDYYINFTVLETGVVLDISEDGLLTMFLNNIDKFTSKEIKDDVISTEWKLTHEGAKAMFYKNDKLFELKMS